jgi:hypothetical protein
MQDELSRLVGIDGVVVTGVVEVGRQLEIEVELVTAVACCRWCGRASLVVRNGHWSGCGTCQSPVA